MHYVNIINVGGLFLWAGIQYLFCWPEQTQTSEGHGRHKLDLS
uniref:Uncharacterized protein n=1 Tax=Rhizophora mucronata TaxID=61149 RepID=A0A2P2NQU1_RHIMU